MNLQFFPSDKPNKTGVLVAPGGGYGFVALDHEGNQVARWLNARGFDAWVLDYTVASPETPAPIYPKPQNEALEAIRQIRVQNRVSKLGMWGFSAGGHLTAITLTNPEAKLDFGVLAYPVISMEPGITHAGSRANLLGDSREITSAVAGAFVRSNLIGNAPDPELLRSMSAQNRVSLSTPPVFLFHTANDPLVPVQNSLLFASEMAAHRRPFETLILPDGPHGIGLALNNASLTWTGELERWLKGFVS